MRWPVMVLLSAMVGFGGACATAPNDAPDDEPDAEVLGEGETDPLPDDDDVDLPDDDAGTIEIDADTPDDADEPFDAGASPDAGMTADVGTPLDLGAPIDLGAPFDAGTPTDLGVAIDLGSPRDAGTPRDLGLPPTPCLRDVYRLRHLHSSQQRTDPESRRHASIDAAFASGADTISWTEIESLSDIRYLHARAGWTTYWPSGRPELLARNAVPISWRNDTFRLVRGISRFASPGLAHVSPSRWVTRVWLRHRASGGVVSRVAHHSVSGVDGAGRAPVAWRRMAHAQDIETFRDVLELDSVPVLGAADFNTTRLRSLLGSEFAYDVPSSGGSHGARLIDWIVRRPHHELRFLEAHFVTVGASDHRGVTASYEYTPPCR